MCCKTHPAGLTPLSHKKNYRNRIYTQLVHGFDKTLSTSHFVIVEVLVAHNGIRSRKIKPVPSYEWDCVAHVGFTWMRAVNRQPWFPPRRRVDTARSLRDWYAHMKWQTMGK